MTEQGDDNKYITCSRCVRKFINDDDHTKNEFGYNRLEERFETCVQCRDKKRIRCIMKRTEMLKRSTTNSTEQKIRNRFESVAGYTD